MLKLHLLLFLFLSIPITSIAQSRPTTYDAANFWSKVRFGGGVGLNFGNGFFSGTLAPSAVYEVNPYFAVGPGLNFSYVSDNQFKSTIYGGSVIALANPFREVQLSAELEQLRVNQRIETTQGDFTDNFWNTALFLGAGYRTSFATVGIRYNVLFEENEGIYANAWQPFVRFYF
ncbi:hypothetical protein [Croceiramulus getboli]|nr:hypothetical protein P8624_03590 [Flavobacteriaceae bacterium YJPT1-3]